MKWLIYLLLLANLGLLAWSWQQGRWPAQKPPAPISDTEPGHVRRLLLLSEVDTGHLQPPVRMRDEPEPQSESAPRPEPETAPDKPPAKPPVAPPVVAAAAPSPEPESTPDPEPVRPEPAPPTRPAPDREPPEPAVAEAPPPVPVTGRSATGAQCFSVGPIESDEAADETRGWLEQRGARLLDDQVIEEQVPRSYWVYLPPYPSVEAAEQVMDRLKEKGVKDYARVTSGAVRNALSLGLYSQVASAERRLQELEALGFNPKVKTRYSENRVHRLSIELNPDGSLDAAALRGLAATTHRIDCP